MIRVTVWNENVHERKHPAVRQIYPEGIHTAIAGGLRRLDRGGQLEVRTATLDQPDHGLGDAVLGTTDVLTWWGHCAHDQVADAVAERVVARVHQGMGLIVLHSGHFSKVFKRLMGTPCALKWREAGERERLWTINPAHPIARGIGPCIELEHTEMYGEPFSIPEPEEQVFISWFEGGEVFRSGNCWRRGNGRIFYFRPGHETYPIYHHPAIQQVIFNAVLWAAPTAWWSDIHAAPNVPAEQAPEPIRAGGASVH